MTEQDKFVFHGPEPASPVPDVSLGKLIFDSLLTACDNHNAMIDVFTGKTLSYKELIQETCNLAEALRTCVTIGEVVSICSENSLDFFIPVIAALYAGNVVAPVNHYYTPPELEHNLNLARPAIIFCSAGTAAKVLLIKNKVDYIKKVIIIGSDKQLPHTELLKDFIARALPGRSVLPYKFQPFNGDSAKQTAFILCSSGTTGLPKGVMLSHRNFVVRLIQSRDPRYILSPNNRTNLGLLPFFHAYGLNIGLNSIMSQQTVVVMKNFEEDVFLRTIQDFKISSLALAPPLVLFLTKTPKIFNYDLSSVEHVSCGAAPLSESSETALKKRLNIKTVRQGYGLTEVTLAATLMEKDLERPGSCGKILTYAKGIVRDPETGKNLGPNQVGELCFKGPMVMMGYINNKKATEESFTHDGWLKTGDLGYYDKDEFFFIVDRLKELIKYKGYQVAPAELEAILLNYPKIKDVGVVGLPDELAGELPVAFVVKTEGVDVTEKEIQKYVADRVSAQKRLRGGVIFVESIPKNASGKILRKELRQWLAKNHVAKQESKL